MVDVERMEIAIKGAPGANAPRVMSSLKDSMDLEMRRLVSALFRDMITTSAFRLPGTNSLCLSTADKRGEPTPGR